MSKRKYIYRRSAFKPLPARLEHMDIYISFHEDRIEARNTLYITALTDLPKIKLDAKGLKILSVRQVSPIKAKLRHSCNHKANRLTITLPSPLKAGESIAIAIESISTPSDNILEGIYRDTTPPGAPQQYMSQCQQWGFQRIMPVFDDCTAKCTMITTLEGDTRYTHLISNGNISPTANPDAKPEPLPEDPSRMTITYENMIPMTPYLFIACAGTWDELADTVTYPSGRKVRLEYLVPRGSVDGARIPMEILKDSMQWHARTQNYEYKRDVYRTICMEKSNFGGMENVGNTTIVTSAALIDDFISDARLEYAHGVIIHEFEHNQCGSDVTMETPFDIWLNEAFTVDVERQYSAFRFDPACQRLDEVDAMRSPVGGPLAIEDAGHRGNILRTGFNDPDELIDGVTYVKSAEVIRMLRTILGADNFTKAKDLYFSRYTGGNANTDQFFACFEEVSGRDLTQFKREWLTTIGYPVVTAKWKYSRKAKRLRINLEQTRTGKGRHHHVPVQLAAVDSEGNDIPASVRTVELTGRKQSVLVEDIEEPAFLSLNRDCSFYGTFHDESATVDHLLRQVKLDPDTFNRVEAMRKITDLQRITLLHDPIAEIDARWLYLYRDVAANPSVPTGVRAYLLRIDEQSSDRKYLPWYPERNRARSLLMKKASGHCWDELMSIFESTDTYTRTKNPADGIPARSLRNTVLRVLSEMDTPDTHAMSEGHLNEAWNITDKTTALACIQASSHPNRLEILERVFETWRHHLNGYSSYLAVIASGTHDDVFEQIAREENRSCFNINHPNHARALYLSMTMNNRMLWTEAGQDWLAETAARMARVNDFTASRMVDCLQLVGKMRDNLRPLVINTLKRIEREIDSSKAPMTEARVEAFLKGAEKQNERS